MNIYLLTIKEKAILLFSREESRIDLKCYKAWEKIKLMNFFICYTLTFIVKSVFDLNWICNLFLVVFIDYLMLTICVNVLVLVCQSGDGSMIDKSES